MNTTLTPPAPDAALAVPEPVDAVPVEAAPSMVPLDPDVVPALDERAAAIVERAVGLDVRSADFAATADAVRALGDDSIASAASTSTRLLAAPVRALRKGPLTESGKVATTLVELRRTVEGLDPAGGSRLRRLISALPRSERVTDYFRRYESSQAHLDAIITALHDGQDELRRDNAALETEKAQLWESMQRLVEHAHVARAIDEELSERLVELDRTDPERARTVREDVLFYARRKHQDLLTQLAVSIQGYLAIDLVRRNNNELIKGVDRATTTTVAALRTAVIVAQALANQQMVLDQVEAINGTTSQLMDSTSQMLATHSAQTAAQASQATVDLDTLREAFANVYRSMDAIDSFKVEALDAMSRTVSALRTEIERTEGYLARVAPDTDRRALTTQAP